MTKCSANLWIRQLLLRRVYPGNRFRGRGNRCPTHASGQGLYAKLLCAVVLCVNGTLSVSDYTRPKRGLSVKIVLNNRAGGRWYVPAQAPRVSFICLLGSERMILLPVRDSHSRMHFRPVSTRGNALRTGVGIFH